MSFPLLAALLLVAPAVPVENNDSESQIEAREDEQDEVICRRQLVESTRFGERLRSIRVCKTREEWRNGRGARR